MKNFKTKSDTIEYHKEKNSFRTIAERIKKEKLQSRINKGLEEEEHIPYGFHMEYEEDLYEEDLYEEDLYEEDLYIKNKNKI